MVPWLSELKLGREMEVKTNEFMNTNIWTFTLEPILSNEFCSGPGIYSGSAIYTVFYL